LTAQVADISTAAANCYQHHCYYCYFCNYYTLQFARLERLAELEEERAAMMQRIDAEFEKKMRAMRGELMDIVDQDYRKRRETLNADAKARRNTKV
jgi:hypothetical protein